jgi:HEAT repeat protein
MKRHRKANGAAFALVLVAVLSVVLLQSREPAYRSKPLSAWLQDWDNSFGPKTPFRPELVNTIENAIRQMGSNAVPSLRSMLRTRDTGLRQKVVAYCSKRPWIPIHFRPPAYRMHIRGMFGIRALGAVGKPAIPELVSLLSDPDWTVRAWGAGTLGKVGREANAATPDLTARLSDKDEHVRQAACDALAEIGASKEVVLPALMPCLRDTNDGVFNAALRTASRMGVGPSALVPAVTDQLNQQDPRVRYQAAMALGGCGDKARSAIPELLKAVRDVDKDVREAAAGALIKIDPSVAVEAKLPPPTGPASDAGAVSVNLAMQGPTSMALDIYRSIAGVELVMKFQGPLPGFVNVRATRPLSQKEAMEFLEKALLDQCGIVLERIDDKQVAVKMRHQK